MKLLAVACFPGWGPLYGGPMRVSGLLGSLAAHAMQSQSLVDRIWRTVNPSRSSITLVHPAFTQADATTRTPQRGCRQIGIPVWEELARVPGLPRGSDRVSVADIALAMAGPQGVPSLDRAIRRHAQHADAIWCFQPYLFPFVEHLGKPIIVDAMDVESDVKASGPAQKDTRREHLEFVRELESRAFHRADAITAVSREDMARIDSLFGVPRERLHHVGNGTRVVRPFRPTIEERRAARLQLGLSADCRPALYFASGHPPNVQVARWIVEWLASRVPSAQFVIAGTVVWPLALGTDRPDENVLLIPEVTAGKRALLYTACEAGLNPVHDRLPGSDLKVLDYLGHALPVIATARGVRGHDMQAGMHYFPMEADAPGSLWKILHDEVLADHLAHHGLEHARRLSWERLSIAAEEVFGSITGMPHRGNGTSTGGIAGTNDPEFNTAQALADFRHDTPTTNAYPTEICFDLTNDCHLRCRHCYRTYMKSDPTYLPIEVFDRIPPDFFRNARQIELSGMGEPMLHPDWDAIIERVAGDGSPLITFNSSFTVYNDDRLRRLVELGTSPAVSVDAATRETFEHIRVRARHERVVHAMERLMVLQREIRHPRFRLRVQWTLYKENIAELAPFMDFAGANGIPEVRVQPLAPHQPGMQEWCCDLADPQVAAQLAGALESATRHGVGLYMHEHLLQGEGVREAARANAAATSSPPPVTWHHHPDSRGCSFPWTQMNIDSAGNLVACCFSDAKFGNILVDDLESLWNGHGMAELRAQVNGRKVARWCVDSPSGGVCCPRVQFLKAPEGSSHFLQGSAATS